jgi:16S rRNA (guanine(527)-N(7))-methyltransferase RsmG
MQRLASGTAQLGMTRPAPGGCLRRLYAGALAWNEQFNLTAITDPEQVEIRHYLDSLALLPALAALEGVSLSALLCRSLSAADVGAGAGLPGLALRILWPKLRLCCIEATSKKVRFLEHMTGLLGMPDVQLVHGRAEELALRPPYRPATSGLAASSDPLPWWSTCCRWRRAGGQSPTAPAHGCAGRRQGIRMGADFASSSPSGRAWQTLVWL